ncbi:MAG: hypothetical protein R3Y53_11580 [Bacillota bacterium]
MKQTTTFKEKLLFDLKSAITHVPNQDEDIPRIMERYLGTTSEKEKNRWLTAFIQCLNREFYEDPLQDYYRYSMVVNSFCYAKRTASATVFFGGEEILKV